ncbi:MAG: AI-2E family transporter [Bacteroidales bacterium]|jgi:predicted PurR-regulated permease PerM|nr:AI-2E family transporter [Bacteroidales bacterium]
MNNNGKSAIALLIGIGIIIFLCWFFSDIVLYIFIAFLLSLLGSPLVKLLTSIRIGKWQFPSSLAAAITLVIIVGIIGLIFYLVIPALVNEVKFLTTLDLSSVGESIQDWLNQFDKPLRKYGILQRRQHVTDLINDEFTAFVKRISMSSVVSSTASMIGSLFVALFSILFMTFFSLKDHHIFFKMIRSWLPNKYQNNFDNILEATGKQFSSYFRGVMMEMFIVGFLEFLICFILGVPNALIIGTIGGLLNIIPYVGTLIAVVVSIIVGVTSLLPASPEMALVWSTVIRIAAAFVVAKLVDDFVLQPYIYGKQTHSHPLEIFIVILMAGYIGGVFSMIFAVPAYTLLRIIINEFFGAQFATADEREEMLTGKKPNPEHVSAPEPNPDSKPTNIQP